MNSTTDRRRVALAGVAPKRPQRNSGGQAGADLTHQDKEVRK